MLSDVVLRMHHVRLDASGDLADQGQVFLCNQPHTGPRDHAGNLHTAEVGDIAHVSENEPLVMNAWGKSLGGDKSINRLAGGKNTFSKPSAKLLPFKRGAAVSLQHHSMIVNVGVRTNCEVDVPKVCSTALAAKQFACLSF